MLPNQCKMWPLMCSGRYQCATVDSQSATFRHMTWSKWQRSQKLLFDVSGPRDVNKAQMIMAPQAAV